MAEEIADRLERRASSEKMDGQRVAQAVRSLERDRETSVTNPALEGFGDRRWLELSGGRSDSEENLALRQRRAPVPQVSEDRGAHLCGQGQQEGREHLGSGYSNLLRVPLDVVEPQRGDLAGP